MNSTQTPAVITQLEQQVLSGDTEFACWVAADPTRRKVLRAEVSKAQTRYGALLKTGLWMDRIDLAASVAGAGLDVSVILGFLAEVAEFVPKAVWGAWYLAKTRDWGAVPSWVMHEVFSLTPVVGELADMRFTYSNRAKHYVSTTIKNATYSNQARTVTPDVPPILSAVIQ